MRNHWTAERRRRHIGFGGGLEAVMVVDVLEDLREEEGEGEGGGTCSRSLYGSSFAACLGAGAGVGMGS